MSPEVRLLTDRSSSKRAVIKCYFKATTPINATNNDASFPLVRYMVLKIYDRLVLACKQTCVMVIGTSRHNHMGTFNKMTESGTSCCVVL